MGRVGVTARSAVDRTACINIRELPLQLLLRRHPEWRKRPVAVVEQEKPQSPILGTNPAAARAGIGPGMRYASALSLDRNLCAGTVSEQEIQAEVRQVHALLDRFSPRIEPCRDEPGIFWADAGGLDRLFDSLHDWAGQIVSRLSQMELSASVAVGFSRFGSYAIAKARRQVTVLPSFEVEEALSRQGAAAASDAGAQAAGTTAETGPSHRGRLAGSSPGQHRTASGPAGLEPLPFGGR